MKLYLHKPKMAYSRDAFTRDLQDTRERDKTRERQEIYGAMEDGLS